MRSPTPGKEAIQQDTDLDFRPFSAALSLDNLLKDTRTEPQHKVSALKTQAVFKLWRHSHHSFSDINFFYSYMENDSIPKPLLLKLNYSRLLIVLALFLSFEVKREVAPSLTPVSSLLDTGREGDVLGKPNTSALYNKAILCMTLYPAY